MSVTVNKRIADDHPVFRTGIYEVLEKGSSFVVAAELNNGEEALNLWR